MTSIMQDKQFQRVVIGPSAVWLGLCAVYVSTAVGWGNLTALMTYELAMMVVGAFLPVCLLAMISAISGARAQYEDLAQQLASQTDTLNALASGLGDIRGAIERQGDASRNDISSALERLERGARESAANSAADISAIKVAMTRVQDLAAGHGSSLDAVKGQLETLVDRLVADDANTVNLDNIQQRTAVLGLVNTVLNDANVALTRLLVRMMEMENRPKAQIRDFIQGLVSAFSVGDRGVFVGVIQHQLGGNMEPLVALQTAADETPAVRNDIAKVMRELREIRNLFERLDNPDLAKTICDLDLLASLGNMLEKYFNDDGKSKQTTVY